jgi:hypothetical protein
VDTCYIDTTLSAEVSEAINSMFRWYARSVVCYAYLSDQYADARGLQGRRWFTQGWTLQELIALLNLVFYNYQCNRRGTKKVTKNAISDATRIPTGILDHTDDLASQPVVRRNYRASRRQNATQKMWRTISLVSSTSTCPCFTVKARELS